MMKNPPTVRAAIPTLRLHFGWRRRRKMRVIHRERGEYKEQKETLKRMEIKEDNNGGIKERNEGVEGFEG